MGHGDSCMSCVSQASFRHIIHRKECMCKEMFLKIKKPDSILYLADILLRHGFRCQYFERNHDIDRT